MYTSQMSLFCEQSLKKGLEIDGIDRFRVLKCFCLHLLSHPKNPWDVMGCQVATCFEAV